ncbi:MAG: hypothetical protein PUC73_01535 [Lachnospiraceae bacterium]|nr:hypothetical protein [Lachnospiraceae bacterium]
MEEKFLVSAIASEDYRKYIIENGIILSDRDMATLIFHNMQLCFDEKMEALQLLAQGTDEEELRTQINDGISRIESYLMGFRESNGNSYYELWKWDEDEYYYYNIGIFLDYDSAYWAGLKEGGSYKITKELFACKEIARDTAGVFGTIEYNPDGTRGERVWLYEVDGHGEFAGLGRMEFCRRGIGLPLCFKRGDIVRIMGTNTYGIVEEPNNSAEEEQIRKFAKKGDYSDFQVTVKKIYNGNRYLTVFAHAHVSPAQLEYAKLAEDDKRKGFLEYMAKTMLCTSVLSGTGRDGGRIPEVVSKIEKVWTQYPDLRLGQLLLNVCGPKDLFALEDEDLMKCFEENIFG